MSHNTATMQSSIIRVAIGTGLLLLVPLVAMQFSEDVNWKLNDFVIAGALLFSAGLVLNLILTRVHSRKRKIIALGLLGLFFLYLWAELAVGIFTHWGS
jgi:hypothetical protein